MKLFSHLLLLSSAIASHLRGNDEPLTPSTVSHPHHRILQEDLVGTYVMSAIQHADYTMSEDDNIEVNDGSGTIYTITNPGKSGWAKEQGLKSGVSTVVVGKGAAIIGATIDVKGNPPRVIRDLLFSRNLKEDELTPEQEANLAKLEDQRRRLAVVTGTRKVLAVKVIHSGPGNLTSTTNNAATIADSIFGAVIGGPDLVNMHSQFKACSHGKLIMNPATDATSTKGNVTNIVNGVVEVTVYTNCTVKPCDGVMRNDVNNALSAAFGSTILGGALAHHVMHCLPPTAMSGIAYAYVNSWNSVYSDKWCEYPSSNLHEIGHNLNLAHSGELTDEYGDTTGFMGYSSAQDDQKRCYNNAKNWQLNWFTGAYKEVLVNSEYIGPIKGQINYNVTGQAQTPIVVKVGNYYIGFNHQAKHNANTGEALNQVTIQEYNVTAYGLSSLKARLSAGGTWSTIIGTNPLTVTVGTITTNADTGVAQVTIVYGVVSPPPTPAPTNVPTSQPTSNPTTADPTNAPTNKPTSNPTDQPTDAPTPNPTNFPTMAPTLPGFCTNGKGRCSDTSLGHLTTDLSACACSATRRLQTTKKPTTSKPTALPTRKPTALPTRKPTALPTRKPTALPTRKPTALPTSAPISSPPTSSPVTSSPTRKPVSSSPTSSPTVQPTPQPTSHPTSSPVTSSPTSEPVSSLPTSSPTVQPTSQPTFCGCSLTAMPTP